MFPNNESLLKFSIDERTHFYHNKTYLDCIRYCLIHYEKSLTRTVEDNQSIKHGVIKLSIQQEVDLKVTIKIEAVIK